MAITATDALNQLIAAAKQIRPYQKASVTSKGVGSFHSLWLAAGQPAAGSAPGTAAGVACDNTTAGAIPITAAGGANTLYLAGLDIACANTSNWMLYDRLVHTAALSGTVITAQTVNSAALTRYTTGDDVECAIEIYTATGATAVTATISYTNEAGTAGRSGTAAIVATTVAGQWIPMSLQAGDKGVRSVQSVTLSASTLTAGNFGITLYRRLAQVPNPNANTGASLDFGDTGLPAIGAACLAYTVLCGAAATGFVSGSVKTAEA
jgi:hypothetical protein